jgi:hypothetical protein
VYTIVAVPVQVPFVVDNVDPKLCVPLTTGGDVLTGVVNVVMLLLALLGLLVPTPFVAVTVNV